MPPDSGKRSAITDGFRRNFYAATDPSLPPEERERQADEALAKFYKARARMGAHARNARASSREEITRAAREALFQQYLDQTDPGLDARERIRQAKSLEKLHMQGLALRRQTVRRRAAAALNRVAEADAQADALGADAI